MSIEKGPNPNEMEISPEDEEPKKTRQEMAQEVVRDIGHIDFSSKETGTYPALLHMGITESGEPMTPKQYVEMYKIVYGEEVEKGTAEEAIIRVAENTFNEGGDNPKQALLDGIKKLLAIQMEGETNTIENTDPLKGTPYEGVPNEELHRGQSVFNEQGDTVNVDDENYREAFLYYTKTNGWL